MERLPTPVFWPGEFHGLHSPQARKESDMTEQLSLHFTHIIHDSVSSRVGPYFINRNVYISVPISQYIPSPLPFVIILKASFSRPRLSRVEGMLTLFLQAHTIPCLFSVLAFVLVCLLKRA